MLTKQSVLAHVIGGLRSARCGVARAAACLAFLVLLAGAAAAGVASSQSGAPRGDGGQHYGLLQLAQQHGTSSRSRQCPRGTTGRWPKCRPVKPPKCPRGTYGRWPNCQKRTCPRGTVGKWPVCVKVKPPKCPRGSYGRWPNCKRRVCPPGTRGRWPDCRKIVRPCPRGTVGRWPRCRKIVPRKCPRGTTGRWPKCKKIIPKRCPKGTVGRWPNCRQRAEPPRRVRPAPVRPQRRAQSRPVVAQLPTQRPDEIVVFLDQSQNLAVALAVAQQYRLVRLQGESIGLLQARVQRYRIPDRRSVDDVIAAMRGDARVSLVQPNYLYRQQQGAAGPSAAGVAQSQYAIGKIRIGQAHALARGRQTLVAVIDSGIDANHPEIAGAVAAAFDAVGQGPATPDDHGTAVAGIIGARGQLVGIAPAARLLAIRAFVPEGGGSPLATTFVLLRSIDWAARNGARLFNLSFAGPHDEALRRIISAAHDKGAVLVAAAGNGGPKAAAAYPAAYSNVIAITATDRNDAIYPDANRGSYVAVAAPGVDILAPVSNGGYDFKSGTSFAAAHVTGMIALMLERNPRLSSRQIEDLLVEAAVDLGARGRDALFGAGRADALMAVKLVGDAVQPIRVKAGRGTKRQ